MQQEQKSFQKNLKNIIKNIKQISKKYNINNQVRIIAVTKQKPDSWYPICTSYNLLHVGENRIDEIQQKNTSLIKLHFLGTIQSRKIKDFPKEIYSIDTLSNIKHISKLEHHFETRSKNPVPILLQVKANNETSKSGISIQNSQEIFLLAKEVISSKVLKLEGLMGMGPTPTNQYNMRHKEYQDATKQAFLEIRILKKKIEQEISTALPRLSMGMSNDYHIALQEKSTEIRIGNLLFGNR